MDELWELSVSNAQTQKPSTLKTRNFQGAN